MRKMNVVCAGILCCVFLLAGCGGGGGGGSTSTPTTTTISGTVSAPSGVSLGRSAGRSAAATGLVAKASVSVQAYLIDDSGNKSGSTLATATTNASGVYSLTLPAGTSAASNLVVVVGNSSNQMRAFVTGTSIDINPLAELVVLKTAENAQPLSNFSVSGLSSILSQVSTDAANVDLSAAATASSAVTSLYTGALKSNLDRLLGIDSGNSSVDGYYSGTSTVTSDTCNTPADLSTESDSVIVSVVDNTMTLTAIGTPLTGTYNSTTGAFSVSGTLSYTSTLANLTCTGSGPIAFVGTAANGTISGTWELSFSGTGDGCNGLVPATSCSQSGTMSYTATSYVALSAPSLSSPSNGATGVATNVTLSWGAVTNASGYEIQAVTIDGMGNIFAYPTAAPTTSLSPSAFSWAFTSNKTYQWKVRAYHGAEPISSYSNNSYCTNCSEWSETRAFTTQ